MKFKILLALMVLASPAWAANSWRGGLGENSILGNSNVSDIDSNSYQKIVRPLDDLLANYRQGLQLTYDSANQLTVSAGSVTVSNADGSIRLMLRNSTSTTVTWADIDTGAEASGTTYYLYGIAATNSATAVTFKISTSSTAPSGSTYYKRLGSFTNDSGSSITIVTNDDERMIVATGTVSNGGTIALPTGWLSDECNWTVGLGSSSPSGSHPDGVYANATVNSSRVATCTTTSINVSGGGSTGTTTCNYLIACYR